ncbi:hypothetical protein EVJ58_g278 [Rhodofomes roseus]|uniref:ferric-chelate reductase (NADPH) n=1 Tax=Rhodofomes roseus TaxID=34475 RepID=A0A4Y9Z4B1_9APHY|nr:hypothetical protein EVJ58_g278 [Rhodofomes roseus]
MHIPAWDTLVRPVIPFLRTPFLEGINLGGTLFCAFYFGVLLFSGLYHTSIFTNPLRPGYVAVSQIPWVVILASKNNIISLLLGIGWDHLNYIHRFAGRLLTIAANIHVIGYVYKWTMAGSFVRHISEPRFVWGVVAIVCIDILFFFSLAIWRSRAYSIFYLSHIASFIGFLVTVCLHMRAAIPWVIASAGIYVADIVLRCIKTRVCTARIQCFPELCATWVEIPSLTSGWRAGQHVRLRVLSRSMGWVGWTETHPFTIASASRGVAQQGLVLLCKNTGRWTRRLQALSRREQLDGSNVTITVMVEGPYGGPGDTMLSSFSGALLVVGGSGISYGLAAAEELIRKAADGTSSVTVLDLVWCVPYSDCLTPMIPHFTFLLAQSRSAGVAFQVTVFHTRVSISERTCGTYELPAGLTLLSGRPSIAIRLRDVLSRTQEAGPLPGAGDKLRGVSVGVCGPLALGEDVRKAIDEIEPDVQRAVGGIELLEE